MMSWRGKVNIFSLRSILNPHLSHTRNAPTIHQLSTRTYAIDQSSYRLSNDSQDENNTKGVDLHIISSGSIKPASPTPHHFKKFALSAIDQIMFSYYTPMILCFPNTDKTSLSNVLTRRTRCLKESLSELLTLYYPFAGEITDNFHIDCNDKGVYFVEARVHQTLEEFLHQPDDQKVRELNPKHPSTTESSLGNYIASVQVNIFNCGGIGLSTKLTHKLVDGNSYFEFFKAWAAVAKGLSTTSPSFVASMIFPHNPSLEHSLTSKLVSTKLLSTKRFVFDSVALNSLKSQTVASTTSTQLSRGPTRTEAIISLVWKAAAQAASTVRLFSPESPHALASSVNLRKRASPPLPNESIGNLFTAAIAICFPNNKLDLSTLMGEVRESIASINLDYIETLKGQKGHKAFIEQLRMMDELSKVMDEGDCLIATSVLNNGMYEVDFGWGRPIWFYHMNPGSPSLVCLNDVVKGGGVEAIVTLNSEEMKIFELDSEILSYTTLNPSPLQFTK